MVLSGEALPLRVLLYQPLLANKGEKKVSEALPWLSVVALIVGAAALLLGNLALLRAHKAKGFAQTHIPSHLL